MRPLCYACACACATVPVPVPATVPVPVPASVPAPVPVACASCCLQVFCYCLRIPSQGSHVDRTFAARVVSWRTYSPPTTAHPPTCTPSRRLTRRPKLFVQLRAALVAGQCITVHDTIPTPFSKSRQKLVFERCFAPSTAVLGATHVSDRGI